MTVIFSSNGVDVYFDVKSLAEIDFHSILELMKIAQRFIQVCSSPIRQIVSHNFLFVDVAGDVTLENKIADFPQ